jgi:uncharacterized linocin/CFP29 family protein
MPDQIVVNRSIAAEVSDSYIMNNVAHGTVAQKLLATDGQLGTLRPYIGDDNRTTYVDMLVKNKKGGKKLQAIPVKNATATLRKDEWIEYDNAVVDAAKPEMRCVNDLRSAGLTFNVPNGWAKTILQWETISGINPAIISMDGTREGSRDTIVYELEGLPLPIIHYDFELSARHLATSRAGGMPLDTTIAAEAGEEVGKIAEKLLLGEETWQTFSGYSISGYTTHSDRITRSLSDPSTADPVTTVREVIAMVQDAQDAYHYGPFVLYYSPGWSQYLSRDYASSTYYGTGTATGRTIKERILQIDQISDMRMASYLTDTEMILVEMKARQVREIIGMEVSTVQWEEKGGTTVHFKVMAILIPNIRSDQNDRIGLVHGTVA